MAKHLTSSTDKHVHVDVGKYLHIYNLTAVRGGPNTSSDLRYACDLMRMLVNGFCACWPQIHRIYPEIRTVVHQRALLFLKLHVHCRRTKTKVRASAYPLRSV